VAYEVPFTELTMAESPGKTERLGLWEGDVVELFVSANSDNPSAYEEYEWAPNGEQLDARIELPKKDFKWQSGAESAVAIDRGAKVWRVEARIPLGSIGDGAPRVGTKWRADLFRHDVANKSFIAWNPTLTDTTHTPERFGWLVFGE
jgi:hypothetical protein